MGQYIGARYVPRFMGTYNATQSYEALDVVDNGLGTSYISKVPTPAGTPLTDTTRWAIYGASSGAIINLQNQIGDLTDLDTTNKDDLVDAINENVSEIEALSDSGAGASSAGDCVFIGDSFGAGIVPAMESQGFTVSYDGSNPGTGFLADGFINSLNTISASVTDKDAVKYVIAVGGTNDDVANVDNTLTTKVTTFCTRAKELYPNARILVGFVATNYNLGSEAKLNVKGFCKQCYLRGVAAAGARVEFIDNLTEAVSDCYRFLSADRVHPNTSGHDVLAAIIIQAVRHQNASIPCARNLSRKTYTYTDSDSGVTFSTTINFCNDGRMPYMIIEAGQISDTAITMPNLITSITLVPPEELPILPMRADTDFSHKMMVDNTKLLWVSLSPNNGLRVSAVDNNAVGTYVLTSLRTLKIDLPLY